MAEMLTSGVIMDVTRGRATSPKAQATSRSHIARENNC